MATRTLSVVITGDAKGAQRALNDTSASADGFGTKLAGVGKAVAGFTLVAGGAITAFALKSASTLQDVGGEVSKLQRYTGDTAEASSRLRTAFELSGVQVDTASRSLGLFSKALVKNPDLLNQLGIKSRDASGHIRPMNDLLMDVADRFRSMPNGAEKSALAMQLFGRNGMEMVKFLNRGSEGLKDLEAKSDEYGLTLSGSNLAAVKQSAQAHRDQTAAMKGLQVQIGLYVLPLITKLTTFAASEIPKVTHWFQSMATSLRPFVTDLVQKVTPAVQQFAQEAQQKFAQVVAWFRQNWPAIRSTVMSVLSGIQQAWDTFGGTIVSQVKNVWSLVGSYVKSGVEFIHGIIQVVTSLIHGDWSGVWEGIKNIVKGAWDWITGLLQFALGTIGNLLGLAWDGIKAVAGAAWDGIKSLIGGVWDWITGKISGAVDGVKNLVGGAWNWVKDTTGNILNGVWMTVAGIWNGIVDFFKGIPGKIGDALSSLVDIISGPFKAAWNFIAKSWNDTIGKLHISIPDWVPVVGGDSFDMPDLPVLHAGGVYRAPSGMDEGLALLQDGERVLSRSETRGYSSASGSPNVHIHLHGVATVGTKEDIGRHVEEVLRKWQRVAARPILASS